MKYSDLTQFDRELIKGMARDKYIDGHSISDSLIEVVFECLNAKGYSIVKDETKPETWSKPKAAWYSTQGGSKGWLR